MREGGTFIKGQESMLSPPHPKISLSAGLNEDKKKCEKGVLKLNQVLFLVTLSLTPNRILLSVISDKKCPYLSPELFRVM